MWLTGAKTYNPLPVISAALNEGPDNETTKHHANQQTSFSFGAQPKRKEVLLAAKRENYKLNGI